MRVTWRFIQPSGLDEAPFGACLLASVHPSSPALSLTWSSGPRKRRRKLPSTYPGDRLDQRPLMRLRKRLTAVRSILFVGSLLLGPPSAGSTAGCRLTETVGSGQTDVRPSTARVHCTSRRYDGRMAASRAVPAGRPRATDGRADRTRGRRSGDRKAFKRVPRGTSRFGLDGRTKRSNRSSGRW